MSEKEKKEKNSKKKVTKKEAAVAAVLAASLVVPTAGAVKLAQGNKREEDKLQAEYQEVEGVQASDNRKVGDLGTKKVLNKYKVDTAPESLNEIAEESNEKENTKNVETVISNPEEINVEERIARLEEEKTDISDDTVTAQFNEAKAIKSVSATTNATTTYTCGDNVTATLNDSTGVFTISGTGAMYDYKPSNLPWYDECSNITSVVIQSGVTSIGNSAFFYCENLTNITIANTVKSIGNRALERCSNLTFIDIPTSVTSIDEEAFNYCSKLASINVNSSNSYFSSSDGILYNKNKTSLIKYPSAKTSTSYTIPNTVTIIKNRAFENSSSLTSISLSSNLQTIGEYAFNSCKNLTNINNMPSTLKTIGKYAFANCSNLNNITIPDGVTSIGEEAFRYCSSLTSIIIPNSVTYLGDYGPFDYCVNLKTVTLSNKLTQLGIRAFSNCTSLTNITIPSTVTSIGNEAFSYCTALKSVTISSGITSIGESAFYNCTTLNIINIPNTVQAIGNWAFRKCSSLTSIELPNSVETMGEYVFVDCSSLQSAKISSKVIGKDAFNRCTNLTNLQLLEGIETIGKYAFVGCKGLTIVKIPNTVTTSDYMAFDGCTNIEAIIAPSSIINLDYGGLGTTYTGGSIYCKSGSAAEAYAQQYERPYVICSLSASPTSGTAYAGGNNVTTTISGENGTRNVKSSNTSIATASISGNTVTITPKAAGTATITVGGSYLDEITTTYTLTVKATSVAVSPTSGYVKVGGTTTSMISGSNYGTLSVTSSDSTIATGSISGTTLTISGKKAGTATLTVKEANGNKTATYNVTVSSIGLNSTSGYVAVNGTTTTTISGTNYGTATASSSDSTIATVSVSGTYLTIYGKKAGTATITVTGSNGSPTATYNVTVSSLSISPTSKTIDLSGTKTFTITATKSNAGTVTWTTSNNNIASLSATTGDSVTVTGKANGTATITATGANGSPVATCSVTVQTTPTAVSVSPTSKTLDLSGTKTVDLSTTITPSTANASTGITWSSSNTSVATVNSSGKVTGVANGTATITATTANNKTATCSITVQTTPTSVSINGGDYVKVGGTTTYSTTITPSTANASTGITWTSSDTSVATVNSSGVITGIKAGTATITATTANNKSTTKTITVSSVSLSPTSSTLDLSTTKTATITVTKSNAGTISWVSSNTNVATVSSTTGDSITVTGVANGTATITATGANGSPTATCSVTVQTTATSVTLDKTSSTLDMTGTKEVELNATINPSTTNFQNGLTWTTSDSTVASIDKTTGNKVKVTGHKNGTATITVKTDNNKTATCNITVQTTLVSVSLDKTNILLDKTTDPQAQLTATKNPTTSNVGDSLTWTSSNEAVATVDQTGKVISVANGTAVITVTSANGKSASCNVTVRTSVDTVTLDKSTDIIDLSNENVTSQLTATINPSSADTYTGLTWSSSDETVATVDQTGKVTGHKNGTTTITVTSENGKTASCEVTVRTTPTEIRFDKRYETIDLNNANKDEQMNVTILPATANYATELTWTSSKPEVATVDQTGKVTGISNGKTIITATTANGKTAKCEITVETALVDVSLKEENITLDMSTSPTKTIELIKTPETANEGTKVRWSSDNTDVVKVNWKGELTAISNGTATITGYVESIDKTLTCNVTVQTSVTEITLNETEATVDLSSQQEADKQVELTATINPEIANIGTNLTWTTSDDTVASISDETGTTTTVTGLKNGTATITVESENGTKAEFTITVQTSVTGITLNKTEETVDLSSTNEENKKLSLIATINPETANVGTNLTWTTSDDTVASISNTEGETTTVTGLKNGTATITVESENGTKAEFEITVQTSVTEVTLDVTEGIIDLSEEDVTAKLNATINPETANVGTELTWTSNKPDVLEVAQDGTITGKSNGIAEVTVTSANGKTATAVITVQTSVTDIDVTLSSTQEQDNGINLNNIDKTIQILATVVPGTANVGTRLTYTSSNEEVATVSDTGLITGRSNGEAIITVESENGTKKEIDITVYTTVTDIELNKTIAVMDLSETNEMSLTATILPATANVGRTLKWSSSDEEVATVDEDTGLITGHKNGETTITVESENGTKATCRLTVVTSVTGVSLNKEEATIDLSSTNEAEKQVNLIATISPETADTYTGLTWTSSDETVVSLNKTTGENVTVTGLKNGTSTITVTSDNGKTATCEITVQTSVTNISLDKMYETIDLNNPNKQVKMNVTIEPETADAHTTLTWTSSNEEVATVDDNGVVTGLSNGTTIIKATTGNGLEVECEVTVKTTLQAISLAESNIELDVTDNKTHKLEVIKTPVTANSKDRITWTSSDASVAIVNKEGEVTAVGNGTAIITATSKNGLTATCNVTVQTSVESISLNVTDVKIDLSKEEKEVQLEATINPETTNTPTTLTWESSNPEVATVDQTGKITGISNGTAEITVTSQNGKQKTIIVTVGTTPTELSVEKTASIIDLSTEETTAELGVKVLPEDADTKTDISWTSSNPEVATVDDNGVVTGLSNGTVTITAETENGVKETFEITVQTTLQGINLSDTNVTLDTSTNKTYKVNVEKIPANANVGDKITWRSSDTSKVLVSNTGEITAVGNGEVLITATSENGKTAMCRVTVVTSATGISFEDTNDVKLDLNGEKETKLKVTMNPTTSNVETGLTWKSSNENVAVVDNTGKITGISNGTVTITVETENGVKATKKVTVVTTPSEISTNVTKIELDGNKERTTKIEVKVLPETANEDTKITYTSGDQTVAIVDKDGNVTAVGDGETTITIKTENGKTLTIPVVVTNVDQKINNDGREEDEETKLREQKDEQEAKSKATESNTDNTNNSSSNNNNNSKSDSSSKTDKTSTTNKESKNTETSTKEGTSSAKTSSSTTTPTTTTNTITSTSDTYKGAKNAKRYQEFLAGRDNYFKNQNKKEEEAQNADNNIITDIGVVEGTNIIGQEVTDAKENTTKITNETSENTTNTVENNTKEDTVNTYTERLEVKDKGKTEETAMTEYVVKGAGIVGIFSAISAFLIAFFVGKKKDDDENEDENQDQK